MKELLFFLILFISAVNASAKAPSKSAAKTVRPLFGYSHINLESGARSGWFIDSEGNIRGYEVQSSKWRLPARGYISGPELAKNFSYARHWSGRIDKKFLSAKSSLIKPLAKIPFQEPVEFSTSTAESYMYVCYYWNAARKKYKEVLLKESGRREYLRSAADAGPGSDSGAGAGELVTWLEGVESAVQAIKNQAKKVDRIERGK